LRQILILITFLFTSSVMASTGDEVLFNFDGSDSYKKFHLKGTKTHTEFRYEQRPQTCFRREFAGYQTRCHFVDRKICKKEFPARNCEIKKEKVCRNVAVYRKVPYTCMVTVRTPFIVFDYYTEAKISIQFGEVPKDVIPSEDFKVALMGEDISLTVTGSKKLLIEVERSEEEYFNGSVKIKEVFYEVKFYDMSKILTPLENGIREIELERSFIRFSMDETPYSNLYQFQVKIDWVRAFRKNPIELNKLFEKEDFQTEDIADETHYYLETKSLGLNLDNRRYRVTVRAKLNVNEDKLLNLKEFPTFVARRKALFKFKKKKKAE
jgi:hypothetical protein